MENKHTAKRWNCFEYVPIDEYIVCVYRIYYTVSSSSRFYAVRFFCVLSFFSATPTVYTKNKWIFWLDLVFNSKERKKKKENRQHQTNKIVVIVIVAVVWHRSPSTTINHTKEKTIKELHWWSQLFGCNFMQITIIFLSKLDKSELVIRSQSDKKNQGVFWFRNFALYLHMFGKVKSQNGCRRLLTANIAI